jgi:hypothetical protein
VKELQEMSSTFSSKLRMIPQTLPELLSKPYSQKSTTGIEISSELLQEKNLSKANIN